MRDAELMARIEARTRQLLSQAATLCRAHQAGVPAPVVRFDLRGQAAGQAVWRTRERPMLRYNLDIARRHESDFLERTVTHEVAHLITTACHGRTRPHGQEWRAVMRYLGIPDADRCHDYRIDESEITRQRRWAYVCDCASHQLSTTRHRRVQSRVARYHCRKCKAALRRAPDATIDAANTVQSR